MGAPAPADTQTPQDAWVNNQLLSGGQKSSAPTLSDRYEAALKSSNWQEAAELLNGFNQQDITKRLAKLKPGDVGKIHQGAVSNPRVGPKSNVALMTDEGEGTRPS